MGSRINILLELIFFTGVICVSVDASGAEWTYGDHSDHSGGSQLWNKIYPACGGSQQSPIDLIPLETLYVDDIESFRWFGYSNELTQGHKFSIVNNGHTVQLNVNTSNISISGGGLTSRYTLVQVHMHWGDEYSVGSEHTINGWSYPLEIHMVHYNSDLYSDFASALNKPGGLAVLGVFAQVNAVAFRNEGMKNIINTLKQVEFKDDRPAEIDSFALKGILPQNTAEFYRYRGSLTTPPCYESVIWTVFRHPINISSVQLAKLRTLNHFSRQAVEDLALVNNFRPVQPRNGRHVLRTFSLKSAAQQQHHGQPSVHASDAHGASSTAAAADLLRYSGVLFFVVSYRLTDFHCL